MTDGPYSSRSGGGGKTLAGIVGLVTAGLLFTQVPMEESGRKVEVSIAPNGQATVRHVSGKQYLRAYLDIVGVATACDGLTGPEIDRARREGRVFTEAQCARMLEEALIVHAEGVMRCSPGLALTIPRRDHVRFAAVSLAYNIGVVRYCGSTARRMFNAGLVRAGCDAILRYNKGRVRGQLVVIRGLKNRRERERAHCLKDAW